MHPVYYHANPLHGQVGIGTYLSGVRTGIAHSPDPGQYTPIEAAGRAWLREVQQLPEGSVYFGTESYDFLPWKRRTIKQVVNVHDLILTEPAGGGSRALQVKSRALVRRLHVVDRVLTVSSTVASALPAHLADRVVVAPPGVLAGYEAAADRAAGQRSEADAWVLLAAAHPRKRVPFAIEAFAFYRSLGGQRQLKVISRRPVDLPPGAFSVQADDDQALAAHLADSHALLYPSTAEGYGLPPVEAAYVGTPTLLLSNVPSAREERQLQPFLVKAPPAAGVTEWGTLMREADDMPRPRGRLSIDSRGRWRRIVELVAEVAA